MYEYCTYVVHKKKKSQRKKEVLCLNFLTATSVGVSKKASGGVRRPRERGGARAARAAEQGRAEDRKQREHYLQLSEVLKYFVYCTVKGLYCTVVQYCSVVRVRYCTVPVLPYSKGKYVPG